MKQEKTTEATAKAARVSAAILLKHEKRTSRSISRVVSRSIDGAVAAVARLPDSTKRAALLAALALSMQQMQSELREAIRDERQDTRDAARSRLRAEVKAATGLALLAALFHGLPTRRDDDDAHAHAAADALAIAWRGLAAHRVMRALRQGDSAVVAVEATRQLLEGRTRRTAATETAQAYSDEHRSVSIELSQEAKHTIGVDGSVEGVSPYRAPGVRPGDVALDERYPSGLGWERAYLTLMRRWDAMLDSKVCRVCADLDGDLAELDESFEGGEEPGFVHPHCRCFPTLVTIH